MSYTRLTHDDRVALAALRRLGFSMRRAAQELHKDVSTISRELKRNGKQNKSGYDARHARKLAQERQKRAVQQRKKIERCNWLTTYIIRKLKKHWSPEQIAGRLQQHGKTIICHETIYLWIYTTRPDSGRELAISTMMGKEYAFKDVFPIVGKDMLRLLVGLGVSVFIAILIQNADSIGAYFNL